MSAGGVPKVGEDVEVTCVGPPCRDLQMRQGFGVQDHRKIPRRVVIETADAQECAEFATRVRQATQVVEVAACDDVDVLPWRDSLRIAGPPPPMSRYSIPCRAKTAKTRSKSSSGGSLSANSAGSDLVEERDHRFGRVETTPIVRDRDIVCRRRRRVHEKLIQLSPLVRLLDCHDVRLPVASSQVTQCRRGDLNTCIGRIGRSRAVSEIGTEQARPQRVPWPS